MRQLPGMVSDTGLRSGPENARLDLGQWREAQQANAPFCRLRFHRYLPTVSLGAFETPGHALRREYCREHGIAVVRRPSGGAAVYLDPDQLCWTLTLSRRGTGKEKNIAEWLAWLGGGMARGLQRLGVDAVFSPPNDIEVAGRKLASGFIALSDTALLYQGSLLLDLDADSMLKALRVPTEKLTPEGVRSARGRFAPLRQGAACPSLSGLMQNIIAAWNDRLGVDFLRPADRAREITPADDALAPEIPDWDETRDGWQQALVKTPGGTLYVRLRLNLLGDVLEQVQFAGSIQAYPVEFFASLSAWLAGTPVAESDERLESFFRLTPPGLLGVTVADLHRGLRQALDRSSQQRQFALSAVQANRLMVHAPDSQTAAAIVHEADVMLVPYCAKPSWCKWRHRDGCPECGRCEVGEAYRLARTRGMRVVTITNFEHLERTLGELRARRTRAYVGMCCRHFYLKREYAFREAGIPAVLMDITGSNCYELQQEDLAYAGKFEAQAHLDLELLRQVLRRVPPATGKNQRAAGCRPSTRRNSANAAPPTVSPSTARICDSQS